MKLASTIIAIAFASTVHATEPAAATDLTTQPAVVGQPETTVPKHDEKHNMKEMAKKKKKHKKHDK